MKKSVLIVFIIISLCFLGCNQTKVESEATVSQVIYDTQDDRAYWLEFIRENHELCDSDTKIFLQLFLDKYDEFYGAKGGDSIPSAAYGLFGYLDMGLPNSPEHALADLGWDAIDELYHGNISSFQQKAEDVRAKAEKLYDSVLAGLGWEKAFYVDDFGDKTSNWYIRGFFKGTFSNSATSGSKLSLFIYVRPDYSECSETDSFYIRLIEYDELLVDLKGVGTKDVVIKIRIDDDIYADYPSLVGEKDIYLSRKGKLFTPILKALEEGKEIKFVITERKYTTSTYEFSIDSRGLDSIPHTWKFN